MHFTGIDIIEITRIEKAIARFGKHFLLRIYTEAELKLYGQKPPSLAARFASKEAVMKLLGTGRKGIGWREIETLSLPGGKPVVNLHGRAKLKAQSMGLKEIQISLSHSKEYAIALATAQME